MFTFLMLITSEFLMASSNPAKGSCPSITTFWYRWWSVVVVWGWVCEMLTPTCPDLDWSVPSLGPNLNTGEKLSKHGRSHFADREQGTIGHQTSLFWKYFIATEMNISREWIEMRAENTKNISRPGMSSCACWKKFKYKVSQKKVYCDTGLM